MPPTGAARFGAGPTVQFQEPPPAATTLERPAAPPAAELDVMSRLQADIARLRLELEKARLEREIAQQRQPAPTATPAAAGTPGTPARNTASPPPMPIATPRPDPAAADRRALPQVIEIRGAAGAFAAVVQTQNGQRLTLRPGDDLPNSPLKVQSIEPRQVNFVSQDGNRGPYSVPVSPPIATAPPAGVPQAPVMRPINDAGLATPIVR
jgi:type IV pilus biogenesis protein PilP